MAYFLIILAILMADQVSKRIVEKKFAIGERIPLIKNKLYIEHIKNKGAALGLMEKQPRHLLFAIVFSLCNIIIMFFRLQKRPHTKGYKVALSFILGGALGNIADRIFKKEVTDFIRIKSKHLPIFNLADLFLFVGCMIFFIRTCKDDQ